MGAQRFQKCRSHLKIPATRRVTWSKIHTENPLILVSLYKICPERPGFVHLGNIHPRNHPTLNTRITSRRRIFYVRRKFVLVQKAYRNEALNRSNIFRWCSRFRDGKELVEDDERGDRPKNTAAVADLVKNGHRIASRMIESSNIPKTVVLQILKKDLGKRKLCALLDTWAKGRSSHTLPRHCDGWFRQTFFWQNYYGRCDLVLCL